MTFSINKSNSHNIFQQGLPVTSSSFFSDASIIDTKVEICSRLIRYIFLRNAVMRTLLLLFHDSKPNKNHVIRGFNQFLIRIDEIRTQVQEMHSRGKGANVIRIFNMYESNTEVKVHPNSLSQYPSTVPPIKRPCCHEML